jgi:hypothetical protein
MALRLVIDVVDRPDPPADPASQHYVMEVDLACPGYMDSGDLASLAAHLAQIAVEHLAAPRPIAVTQGEAKRIIGQMPSAGGIPPLPPAPAGSAGTSGNSRAGGRGRER